VTQCKSSCTQALVVISDLVLWLWLDWSLWSEGIYLSEECYWRTFLFRGCTGDDGCDGSEGGSGGEEVIAEPAGYAEDSTFCDLSSRWGSAMTGVSSTCAKSVKNDAKFPVKLANSWCVRLRQFRVRSIRADCMSCEFSTHFAGAMEYASRNIGKSWFRAFCRIWNVPSSRLSHELPGPRGSVLKASKSCGHVGKESLNACTNEFQEYSSRDSNHSQL